MSITTEEALVVSSYGDSYLGQRTNNEDSLGKRVPIDTTLYNSRGSLFVICDGMGGHACGEVASAIAVEEILSSYYAEPGEAPAALLSAAEAANRKILELADENCEYEGMGCTLAAVAVLAGTAVVAHVGDSRVYLVRAGVMTQLTRDHLHVIDVLGLDPEEARTHPLRHHLSRVLGIRPDVRVEVNEISILPDDILLLCSDGLTNALSDTQILGAMAEAEPQDSVRRLLEMAEAEKARDNTTAIVVKINSASEC